MGQRDAELFDQLRPEVLARLLEVRASIDHAYASIPDERMRPQFELVLDRMHGFLATRQVESYRGFARRWMAMRVSDGFAPENLIHAVVAIGDVVVQVAQQRLGASPEGQRFALEIHRLSSMAARMLVEILADDHTRRLAQRAELTHEGQR